MKTKKVLLKLLDDGTISIMIDLIVDARLSVYCFPYLFSKKNK